MNTQASVEDLKSQSIGFSMGNRLGLYWLGGEPLPTRFF